MLDKNDRSDYKNEKPVERRSYFTLLYHFSRFFGCKALLAPKLYNEDGSLNWELFELNGNYYGTWQNPLTSLLKTHVATNKNLGIKSK